MIENSEKILLSIIVPIFNGEQTIERCASFIFNQTLKNFEVIFVDDCSTDQTQTLIYSYHKRLPDKVKCLQSDLNEGRGGARNRGLAVARGEYVGFVDSDDWVDSNLFYDVLNQAKENNADIAIFGVKNEYENSKSSQIRYEYRYSNSIDNIFALHLLCRSYSNDIYISPMVCQKIYKKEFIIKYKLKFERNSYYEDDYFTFKSLLYGSIIIFVPNVFYHYYQNPNSVSHMFSKKHIDDMISAFSQLREDLIKESLFEVYNIEYFSYFDKCIISSLERLFAAEPNINIQKNTLFIFWENYKKSVQ